MVAAYPPLHLLGNRLQRLATRCATKPCLWPPQRAPRCGAWLIGIERVALYQFNLCWRAAGALERSAVACVCDQQAGVRTVPCLAGSAAVWRGLQGAVAPQAAPKSQDYIQICYDCSCASLQAAPGGPWRTTVSSAAGAWLQGAALSSAVLQRMSCPPRFSTAPPSR